MSAPRNEAADKRKNDDGRDWRKATATNSKGRKWAERQRIAYKEKDAENMRESGRGRKRTEEKKVRNRGEENEGWSSSPLYVPALTRSLFPSGRTPPKRNEAIY